MASLVSVAGCSLAPGEPVDGSAADAATVSSAPEPSVSISFAEAEPDSGPDADTAEVDVAAGAVLVAHARPPTVTVHAEPDDGAAVVTELTNPTEVGGPLVFQAVGAELQPEGDWLEVHLPIRPNGSTGWIRRADVTLSINPYRIEIDAAAHMLQVFKSDEIWMETPVAIGTGDTPTPIGRFYVIELLQPPNAGGAYGPFAFGLSGFSETLTNFAGGNGVIGIHGTNDPSSLGSDVSHGCVRMANEVISELAGVLPLGTPVIITA